MKTILQALIDEIVYPLPEGKVINILIKRGMNGDEYFNTEVATSNLYKGAYADCLVTLAQSVNFSESDKSVGTLSDDMKKRLLSIANSIYKTIGEDEVLTEPKPMVYINC